LADLPRESGESIFDACPPRPAVRRMTTGFTTSLAKKVTPCCSVTSVCRAPLPPAGFAAASARSSPPRSLPWTSSNSRPRSSLSSAGSSSSLPSSAWLSSLCAYPVFVSTPSTCLTAPPSDPSWTPSRTPRRLSRLLWLSGCCGCPLPGIMIGANAHRTALSTIVRVALIRRPRRSPPKRFPTCGTWLSRKTIAT
jgi:hypothetical protein